MLNSARKLIDYCYYRCTKAYASLGDSNPEIMGWGLTALPICFNIISLLIWLSILCGVQVPRDIYRVISAGVVIVVFILMARKTPLREMEQLFKDDPHSKRNSVLVCLYMLLSVTLFLYTLYYRSRAL